MSAKGKEAGGVTNRLHEQMGYAYDAAGNLNYRTNNALTQTFGVNARNELTTLTRSGSYTVAGTTDSGTTNLTVNWLGSALYTDLMFASAGHNLADGTNTFTTRAYGSGWAETNSTAAFLPATVSHVYDGNGNLTSDGVRGYEYDDENQLVRITQTNAWKTEFTYDGAQRRRIRKEYTWSSAIGNWQLTDEVRYVYDGNLVLQERNSANAPRVTYTRGLDLSGSLQGAGGIGGLLAREDHTNGTPTLSVALYVDDGKGNVSSLVSTGGLVVAQYLYDAFGNVLAKTGPLADANLYQFSSKEVHAASGLVYFGRRYYSASLQRWVNRDPIGERGGLNTYRFIHNRATGSIDGYGLVEVTIKPLSQGGSVALPALGLLGVGLSGEAGAGVTFDFPKLQLGTPISGWRDFIPEWRNTRLTASATASGMLTLGVGAQRSSGFSLGANFGQLDCTSTEVHMRRSACFPTWRWLECH